MENKTAIITGATKGIGRATAYQFLKSGYNIAICSRTQKDLESLKTKWSKEFPHQKILTAVADFENEKSVVDFANSALKNFETIDVLVNNAGIFLPGSVIEEPLENYQKQMKINVDSAYLMSKTIAPRMQVQQSGHIFNICSIASLSAYAGGTTYSISKYALLGLSDNFREALKPFKVKVTAILPGPTQSFSWEGSGVPTDKLMPAEDIAHLIYECSQTGYNACVEKLIINPIQDL